MSDRELLADALRRAHGRATMETLYLMRLVRQVLDDEHYTASRVAEITGMRIRRVRELLKFTHEMEAKR